MQQLPSFLPSVFTLLIPFIASVALTVNRPFLDLKVRTSSRFLVVAGLTILAQGLHFLEELRSGFFEQLPGFFGLPPISETLFVGFNVAWLGIWVVALVAVRAGLVFALCPLWFLGLAMVLNLVAHPALALGSGEYFPGLWTSPFVGALGILLLRELTRVSAREAGTR